MRATCFVLLLIGCGGGPAAAPSVAAGQPASRTRATHDRAAVDPIAALAVNESEEIAWLAPGDAHLELDTPAIQGPGPSKPLEVSIIDQHGNLVRVAIRLDHARFSLWTDRTRLFAVMKREERLEQQRSKPEMQVTVRAGTRVKRLEHKGDRTLVRYSGAIEAEGWVPDVVLGETGPRHDSSGRYPTGARTLMVIPGTVIRSEPTWSGPQIAVTASGHFLDNVRKLDDAWVEVGYTDGDVSLHGFVSTHAPPGRVHRARANPEVTPIAITANAKVAGGTCLYTRVRGDQLGYLVGEQDVDLDDAGGGWFNLAIDTPWGPILLLRAERVVPTSPHADPLRLASREARSALLE